jgi:hypothetical protein
MAEPSVGLNAHTGGRIEGWDHVLQSVNDILTTSFGVRVMREFYGSFFPDLLGRVNVNRQEAPLVLSAIATGIMQWEPRINIQSIRVEDAARDGSLSIIVEAEYRPRATYGDLTAVGGIRRLSIAVMASGIFRIGG